MILGLYVHSVAWSPTDNIVVTTGNDRGGLRWLPPGRFLPALPGLRHDGGAVGLLAGGHDSSIRGDAIGQPVRARHQPAG